MLLLLLPTALLCAVHGSISVGQLTQFISPTSCGLEGMELPSTSPLESLDARAEKECARACHRKEGCMSFNFNKGEIFILY